MYQLLRTLFLFALSFGLITSQAEPKFVPEKRKPIVKRKVAKAPSKKIKYGEFPEIMSYNDLMMLAPYKRVAYIKNIRAMLVELSLRARMGQGTLVADSGGIESLMHPESYEQENRYNALLMLFQALIPAANAADDGNAAYWSDSRYWKPGTKVIINADGAWSLQVYNSNFNRYETVGPFKTHTPDTTKAGPGVAVWDRRPSNSMRPSSVGQAAPTQKQTLVPAAGHTQTDEQWTGKPRVATQTPPVPPAGHTETEEQWTGKPKVATETPPVPPAGHTETEEQWTGKPKVATETPSVPPAGHTETEEQWTGKPKVATETPPVPPAGHTETEEQWTGKPKVATQTPPVPAQGLTETEEQWNGKPKVAAPATKPADSAPAGVDKDKNGAPVAAPVPAGTKGDRLDKAGLASAAPASTVPEHMNYDKMCKQTLIKCEAKEEYEGKKEGLLNDFRDSSRKSNTKECISSGNMSLYRGGDVKAKNCALVSKFCFNQEKCDQEHKAGVTRQGREGRAKDTDDESEYECKGKDKGRAICNPLVFGLKSEKDPICIDSTGANLTERCDEAARGLEEAKKKSGGKEGYVTNLLDLKKSGVANAWDDWRDRFNQLCRQNSASQAAHCQECVIIANRLKVAMKMATGNCDAAKAYNERAPTNSTMPSEGTK